MMSPQSSIGSRDVVLWALISLIGLIGGAARADDPAMPEDVSDELRPLLEQHKVPALAVAVVVDGKIVATGAAGKRKTGSPIEVTRDDKWHLGSCSKAFTATLAAILVDEGLIAWETTVGEVFSPRRIPIHADFHPVTLKQLLSNTGGCAEDIPQAEWDILWHAKGSPQAQRLQLVRTLMTEAPKHPPGSQYEYSNTGFSVAGAMLETVAKRPYEKLMTERIFAPLGMSSAGFRAPAHNGRVDQPYGHNPKPVDPEPSGDNPRCIAPAGAIHCSMGDWARFAQLHMGTAQPQLLSDEQLQFLHTPVDEKEPYALGWFVNQRGWARGPALNHNGSNTMWYSTIWLAPDRDFAVLVATNTAGDSAFPACDAVAAWSLRRYLSVDE